MFFPVLRGKRFELLAIRDLADSMVDWNCVVPIIEPVKKGGLGTTLDALVDKGLRFAFINNPRLGDFVGASSAIVEEFVSEYLDEYDNYYPALYVNGSSKARHIADFAAKHDIPTLFFIVGEPSEPVLRSIIAAEPAFVAVRGDGRVPEEIALGLVGQGIDLVTITDPFQRQVRNSDYPDREFFSDAPSRIPDATYKHFGDFSIVGDAYADGGGAAYTVALHHIVGDAARLRLDVFHYKSNYSETTANVAGKFMEALTALIEANPAHENDTSALELYRALHREAHFPGLGSAKKLGIMQHLEVVANLLGA